MAPDAVDLHIGGHHERHIGRLGCKLCEHGGGGRSLQRHQRQSVLWIQGNALRQSSLDMGVVGVLHGSVHHEVEPALVAGSPDASDHEIVEDAAILAKQLRIALLVGLEVQHVGGNQRLERLGHGFVALVLGDEEGLAHMGDVEQPRMLAGPVVLGEDARGILHRHVVAGEGHHAGAEGHMLGMERGFQERLVAMRWLGHRVPSKVRVPSSLAARCSAPPLSRDLRDFPGAFAAGYARRWATPIETSPLSRVPAPARSFGLSVSGAVAPSAPDAKVRSLPRGSSAGLSSEEDLHACQQSRALLLTL